MKKNLLILLFLPLIAIISCNTQNKSKLKKDQVIACLGDSVTFSSNNGYAEYLQEYANENYLDLNLTFLNWGKNSETITNLTEIDHPGPRPFVFDRLDNLLNKSPKPDIITFCFGMNCGIYGKPSKQLFDTYKLGLKRFLDRMEKEQIKVILITPPPLVLETAKSHGNKKLVPSEGNYSWLQPYENYDEEVLKEFSDIILSVNHPSIIDKVDIRTPLIKNQEISYGKDPIHPNAEGNKVIANTLIQRLF